MPELIKIEDIDKSLINQAEYARRLGISESYVSKLFARTRKSAKYEKMIVDLFLNRYRAA